MIFMWSNASNFEEDEEEESVDLNDALLDETVEAFFDDEETGEDDDDEGDYDSFDDKDEL